MKFEKLKLFAVAIVAVLPLFDVCAGQDYSGQTVTLTAGGYNKYAGANFTNATIVGSSGSSSLPVYIYDSDFSGADFTNTKFENIVFIGGNNFSGSNITYAQFVKCLQGNPPTAWSNVNLSKMDLSGWVLGVASMENGTYDYINNYGSVNLTDSIINNSRLFFCSKYSSYSNNFHRMLQSTKSWKNKDLSGVAIEGNGNFSADFSGFNLQNMFFGYRYSNQYLNLNLNLTSADMRGLSYLSNVQFVNGTIYKNTILEDGSVYLFDLAQSGDYLYVREYRNKDGVVQNKPAIVTKPLVKTESVAGGAKIAIDMGCLQLNNDVKINFEGSESEKSVLEFMFNTAEYEEFMSNGIGVGIKLSSGSLITFYDNFEIVVELTGSVEKGDNFLLIDGDAMNSIAGIDALEKGENIIVNLNGSKLNNNDWEFYYVNGDFGVEILTTVPEPATCAAILGALALGLSLWRRRNAR